MKLYASLEPLSHKNLIDFTLNISEYYRFLTVSAFGQDNEGRVMPIFSTGNGNRQVIFAGSCANGTNILMRFIDEFCYLCQSKQNVFQINPIHIFNTARLFVIPSLSLSDNVSEDTTVLKNLHQLSLKTDSLPSFTLFDNTSRKVTVCVKDNADLCAVSRAKKLSFHSGFRYDGLSPSDKLYDSIREYFDSACIIGCATTRGENWLDKYISIKRALFEAIVV